MKEIILEVDGITLSGQLYLPPDRMPCPVVCVCHGIPAGVPESDDQGYPRLAERISQEGFAVFIFNFRGTGASGGSLDILGWTRDLKAVIDYLCTLPEVDRSCLWLLGFSGGAAVSIYVAAQDKRISGVAACACPADFSFIIEKVEPQSLLAHFRSVGAVREESFPHSVEEWISGFKLVCPIEYVARIAPRPLLLVHGNRDETVDISHAYRLFEKAGEPKQMIIVDGGAHKLRQDDRAMSIVIDWLKSQCSRSGLH